MIRTIFFVSANKSIFSYVLNNKSRNFILLSLKLDLIFVFSQLLVNLNNSLPFWAEYSIVSID